MRFKILNVGHGLCAYLRADNNNLMVFDCGYNGETNFRPSNYFWAQGYRTIKKLVITNFDQDHIDDLPYLAARFYIERLSKNPSICAEELRTLKLNSGRLSNAMETLLEMMRGSSEAPRSLFPDFPNVQAYHFWNDYRDDFEDTNNISLVTFLKCKDTMFLIPGDLEKPGWEALLVNREFTDYLSQVTYFIASHHGRENGYCSDVFTYCNPRLIIISDGSKKYSTQEMQSIYAGHASGELVDGKKRYVLTTRRDGSIHWDL